MCSDAYEIIKKRFESRQEFVEFHKMKSRSFFIDITEEELLQRKEIAKDILQDMQYELKLPKEEILDYSKTREEFERRIQEFLGISKKTVREIYKLILKEAGQGRC